MIFASTSIRHRWFLNGNRLIFRHPKIELFWEMPSKFSMPRDALLSLAEYLLLTPHGETVETVKDHRGGTRVSVAFSGGVDSAAALELLPEPIPIYTQVDKPKGMHQIENALLSVAEVNGISILSNYDELPRIYDKRSGYFGHAGFTVTSVLLADHFNLGFIADGNVLEFAYLDQGIRYKRRDHTLVFRAFDAAGLRYCMPNAGLTEVSTTLIASKYRYAMGCMRGTGGKSCLKCFKCYRKLALRGSPILLNTETEKRLSLNPIPMLHVLLWARDKYGLDHPSFNLIERDNSWVDKWYPMANEFLPPEIRTHLKKRLLDFGISPLLDTAVLEAWTSQA